MSETYVIHFCISGFTLNRRTGLSNLCWEVEVEICSQVSDQNTVLDAEGFATSERKLLILEISNFC